MGTYGNGKSKPKTEKRNDAPTFRFISHNFSTRQLEELEEFLAAGEFSQVDLGELVLQGYKFSLSFDDKNSCFIASLTDRQAGSPSENSCLTGRGSSALAAQYALFYRHFALASEDWTFFDQPRSDPGQKFG